MRRSVVIKRLGYEASAGWTTYGTSLAAFSSLVRSDFNVIKIEFICAVGEDARAALTISHRIGPFDKPLCGLRFARAPCLAARAGLAAGQILDLQLQAVPGIGLPREGLAESARRFDLPRSQLDLLNVAEQHQLVTLSDDARVAHLAALFDGAHVGFDRVVRRVDRAERRARAFENAVVGLLD